jgi:hypothetical protein
MIVSRRYSLELALAFFFATAGGIQMTSAGNEGPPKLTLEGANGENHCSLDFTTSVRSFKGNAYCKNDSAVKLEVEHAPSASNILVFDDYSCDRTDPGKYFWFYLRTVKENFSTAQPIDLDTIAHTENGGLVAPGLKLISKYQLGSNTFAKRASCVKIEVDAPQLPDSGP